MRFAPEYVASVLDDNFEDAKALFLEPLLAIHDAHLVMLAECGIVPRDEARALRSALRAIDADAIRGTRYDGTYEDLFFLVQRLIHERCDPSIAGRLHTARSRNDIDMTMYRMRVRAYLLDLAEAVVRTRGTLLDLASAHVGTVFPAHTHTQPAQPTTVAHYLMAFVEALERDTVRMRAAFATVNRCPLGACAITGTGFPIDRRRTSDLLGFDAPTGNTYGSIAAADYLLEALDAMSTAVIGIGRVLHDLLLWCTNEVGFLRLADGFVQTSSIMPQKRNPVALEHARALGSKAVGQARAAALVVHNTPFGDIVDTEDDLQPLVHAAFRDAIRCTRLVAASLATATFDVDRMAARARTGWTTVTELADVLAREHGLPFEAGHRIGARVILAARERPETALSALVDEAARDVIGRPLGLTDAALAAILSPHRFVEVRRTPGGPAPDIVRAAIDHSVAVQVRDAAWVERTRDVIAEAARRRREAVEAL